MITYNYVNDVTLKAKKKLGVRGEKWILYRKIPENGDELSILGFGCICLSIKDGKLDREKAKRQVYYAIDHGVNYIDTAWTYHMGENESFLGSILTDGYRKKIQLATKLPSWIIKSRVDMDRILNAQLEKLRTDHIDYYLVHSLIGTLWDRLENLGVTDFLDRAKANGCINNAVFSFHGSIEDFKQILDAYPLDFLPDPV
jgi:predicted aldo/keto reductase-like oxidoreductase